MTSASPNGMLVVRESAAQRDGLFGFLVLAFALAFVRGVLGASTTAGRAMVIVIIGGVLALLLVLWVKRRAAGQWLEVSADAIALREPTHSLDTTLLRTAGAQLRFTSVGAGRARQLALKIEGGDTVMPLHFFTKKKVEAACLDCGWSFVGT